MPSSVNRSVVEYEPTFIGGFVSSWPRCGVIIGAMAGALASPPQPELSKMPAAVSGVSTVLVRSIEAPLRG